MIMLKQMGKYEVTLQRDIFGRYLCRFWLGTKFSECFDKNKFTAYRVAKKLIIDFENEKRNCI